MQRVYLNRLPAPTRMPRDVAPWGMPHEFTAEIPDIWKSDENSQLYAYARCPVCGGIGMSLGLNARVEAPRLGVYAQCVSNCGTAIFFGGHGRKHLARAQQYLILQTPNGYADDEIGDGEAPLYEIAGGAP